MKIPDGECSPNLKTKLGSSREYVSLLKSYFGVIESDQVGFTVCKITFIGLSNAWKSTTTTKADKQLEGSIKKFAFTTRAQKESQKDKPTKNNSSGRSCYFLLRKKGKVSKESNPCWRATTVKVNKSHPIIPKCRTERLRPIPPEPRHRQQAEIFDSEKKTALWQWEQRAGADEKGSYKKNTATSLFHTDFQRLIATSFEYCAMFFLLWTPFGRCLSWGLTLLKDFLCVC